MSSTVRIFRIRQSLSDGDMALVESMGTGDFCFFQFVGGNASETDRMTEQLMTLKSTGALVVGVFRFPFRFEGKRRLQTAIAQYHQMRELCDAITYVHGDGMLQSIEPGTPLQRANEYFANLEEEPIRAIEEIVRLPGQLNIDARDVQTFLKESKGPVYIRTIEGETFDEPLKYVMSAPHLPKDYTEGTQMMINIGYTRSVDLRAFQQMNLRLTDLFHKADLFKLGTYLLDDPGYRFRITLMVSGLQHPFPRPDTLPRFQVPRLWFRRQLYSLRRTMSQAKQSRQVPAKGLGMQATLDEGFHLGMVTFHRERQS
jgi:cell division protein FtsZ